VANRSPAGPDGEVLLLAPFDPARTRDMRLGVANDLFGDRRTELYGAMVEQGAGIGNTAVG
jgi:hypothetical protein